MIRRSGKARRTGRCERQQDHQRNAYEVGRLQAYERRTFRAMQFYWEMVEAFYTTSFMEIFLEPRAKFNLPDAIVAVLAGELEGGWRMAWRRRLFFWLIKIQARWPLVPRISFAEEEARG